MFCLLLVVMRVDACGLGLLKFIILFTCFCFVLVFGLFDLFTVFGFCIVNFVLFGLILVLIYVVWFGVIYFAYLYYCGVLVCLLGWRLLCVCFCLICFQLVGWGNLCLFFGYYVVVDFGFDLLFIMLIYWLLLKLFSVWTTDWFCFFGFCVITWFCFV